MVMPTGVPTAIIGRIIATMDTIARIGRTIAAMDTIARIIEAMGVRRFTSPYHQFGSPSAAATGNPTARRGGPYSAESAELEARITIANMHGSHSGGDERTQTLGCQKMPALDSSGAKFRARNASTH
jgi:hypothetical protein